MWHPEKFLDTVSIPKEQWETIDICFCVLTNEINVTNNVFKKTSLKDFWLGLLGSWFQHKAQQEDNEWTLCWRHEIKYPHCYSATSPLRCQWRWTHEVVKVTRQALPLIIRNDICLIMPAGQYKIFVLTCERGHRSWSVFKIIRYLKYRYLNPLVG